MSHLKYTLWLLIVLSMMVGSGCQQEDSGEAANPAPQPTTPVITEPTRKIVILIPETTGVAGDTTRQEIRDGIALGLKEQVVSKDILLEIVFPKALQGDTSTDGKNVEDGIRELYYGKDLHTKATNSEGGEYWVKTRQPGLYNDDDVLAVITSRSAYTREITSEPEKNGLLVVASTATDSDLANQEGGNLVLMAPSNNYQGERLFSAMKSHPGKRVAILLDQHPDYYHYSTDLAIQYIMKYLEPTDVAQAKMLGFFPFKYTDDISSDTMDPVVSALETLFAGNTATDLDMLVYLGSPVGFQVFFNKMKSSSIDLKAIDWLSNDTFLSEATLTAIADGSGELNANSFQTVSLADADATADGYNNFIQTFQSEHSGSPTIWHEWGYDTGMYVGQLIKDIKAAGKELTRVNMLVHSYSTIHTGITGKKGRALEDKDRGNYSFWTADEVSGNLVWTKVDNL